MCYTIDVPPSEIDIEWYFAHSDAELRLAHEAVSVAGQWLELDYLQRVLAPVARARRIRTWLWGLPSDVRHALESIYTPRRRTRAERIHLATVTPCVLRAAGVRVAEDPCEPGES